LDVDGGFEGGEGHVLVGGVRGDAVLAGAEDGEVAIETVDGGTSGARLALVAGEGCVAEVDAAGALEKVAGGARHVAQLRAGARQDGLGEHGVIAEDGGVVGDVGVAGEGAEVQAAVWGGGDGRECEFVDVDEGSGLLDVELHHIDEVCASGDEAGGGGGVGLDGLVGCGGAGELEGLHVGSSGEGKG